MPERRGTVVVLGGGVIGLSTAVVALEAGFQVDVLSWLRQSANTSAAAGASFKPAAVDNNEISDDLLNRSWRRFGELVDAFEPTETGVRRHFHWEASSSPLAQAAYLRVFDDVQHFVRPEVPGGYAFGRRYTTFFIDSPVYLPWLQARVRKLGGVIRALDNPITRLRELDDFTGDILVNCTGFGSAALFGDTALVPVKGQIALVGPRVDMEWSISADGFYVYPRSHDTVLGGTARYGDDSTYVDETVTDLLVRANQRILPDVTTESVVANSVGTRPYRIGGVRIESETIGARVVVHNYGHGGAGVTLSWGSAELALVAVISSLSSEGQL